MKLLVCHPGAGYSTADVHNGLYAALERAGIELHTYDLESRLEDSGRWLNSLWHRAKRNGLQREKYSQADVIYGASKDIIERALRWNVDGVLIVSAMYLHPDLLILLQRAHIRTAIVLTESPYDDEKQITRMPMVDLAWTNERSSVERLRQGNPNVFYLPHAYNPEAHHAQSSNLSDVPAHDVVFVGSLFTERVELLSQVDWSDIDLALYGDWRGLPSRHKLRQYVRGDVVANSYAADLYRNARIGLNLYRTSIGFGRNVRHIDHAESLNPRALELAACGTFQISHYRAEVAEVFGWSVPTFRTAADLQDLVRYYVNRPALRARAAQQAMVAVQGHTFTAMARQVLSDLEGAGWPVRQRAMAVAG